MTKNNYTNNIGWDTTGWNKYWEGVLGDGLEGNFGEEGLPLYVQSKFECLHGCSGHNILWQLVPVWDYSDAERMLATTSLATLANIVRTHGT